MGRGQDRKDEKRKCTSNDTPWKAWRCFFVFAPLSLSQAGLEAQPGPVLTVWTNSSSTQLHQLGHWSLVWGTNCAAKDGENCELGIDTGREAGKDSNRSRLQGMELHPG